jgi:hypothetical protein
MPDTPGPRNRFQKLRRKARFNPTTITTANASWLRRPVIFRERALAEATTAVGSSTEGIS